jgi:carboxypeptidase PM20D1
VQAEEASQISPYRGSEYIKLQRALIETFGSVVTVPGIVAGNSSLNMYRPYADSVYQITPFVLTEDEISTVHGINERIGIEALGRAVIFYEKLLNMVAG